MWNRRYSYFFQNIRKVSDMVIDRFVKNMLFGENFFVNNNILLLLCYWQFNIIFNHKTVRSTHIKRGNVHWKKIDFQTFVHTLKSLHNLINILSPFFSSFFWHVNIYLSLWRPYPTHSTNFIMGGWLWGYTSISQKFMLINVKSRAAI